MIARLAWEDEYKKEFQRAIQARAEGNEGMSRVCCRRAAGILIGEHLRRRGITIKSKSAYERLSKFKDLPDIDENMKRIAGNFLIKVNQEHKLPADTDLIQDVAWLKDILLASRE